MKEEKLDPETLPKFQEKEKKQVQGRLKIFLGMAAGVGKTYAMLEAAQKKAREGVEILVGIINTHGRPETEKLLEHLKIIPERKIIYKEKEFQELDLDEIIRLKPQLVLIDELAHTNVPGSKHLKRWHDIIEILDAGIDVYSTLNVQHIESYKDVVEGITGIKIRETVPDLILERASSITCVDLTPAELLQRFREGKVYIGDLTQVALRNFFQEDRLTALREIALRCTAELVDCELHAMIKEIQSKKGWKARERLLVAINHHPFSQQLIRTTRRLSFNLHAPWIAVYVDEGERLDDEQSAMLSKNLALVRELGGEAITTQDPDVAIGIQRVAEQKNITQIIIGKNLKHRFFKKSPVDKLIKITSGIDVHIIRQSEFYPRTSKKIRPKELGHQLLSYLHILFWVMVLSQANAYIEKFVGYRFVGNIFLISILFLSLFFRRGPIFLASILFALIWDFYFVPPPESLKVFSAEDAGFLVLFLLAATVTGILSNRVRKRQELLYKKEQSIQAIYEIGREISSAPTIADLFQGVKEKLGRILRGTCEILVSNAKGELYFENAGILEDEKEKAVATWVFENGTEAGWSTSTLPSVKNLYIPLKGFKETMGVLCFRPNVYKLLLPEETNFMYTVVQQLANYIERSFSEEKDRKNNLIHQIEQIYAKVLQSISDELYRPLKIIHNTIGDLKEEKAVTENLKFLSSLHKMEKISENLMGLAENASAMAKLSGGFIAFEKAYHDVETLIQAVLRKIHNSLKYHQIKILVNQSVPQIPCDFSLMTVLLHHLLLNAIEYSPPHSTIEITAEVYESTFVLSVSDEGKGIPQDRMELVFEKFYRLQGTVSTGLGLGLAIVKSIAEIHHGNIQVQNRESGGTKFSLILPL